MGLFSRKPRQDASNWVPVRIGLLEARRPTGSEGPDSGEATVTDFLIDLVTERGGTPYRFLVEVRPPNGQPYQIEHREKVPDSVTGQGVFASGKKIPAGIELAGWADAADPSKISIDWTSFGATPEAKAEVEDAEAAEQDRLYAQHVLAKQKPVMQQKLRDSAWMGTSMNAEGVASGAVDFAQWDRDARRNVRRGLLTPEQYEQALAVARPPAR